MNGIPNHTLLKGRSFPTLIRPDGHLLPREKVFLRFLNQWILQLRAGMLFVQNDMLKAMGTDSEVSVTDGHFVNKCFLPGQIQRTIAQDDGKCAITYFPLFRASPKR